MNFEDKTAVITGGSSGLGRAMAVTFADRGASVVNADLQRDPREGGPPTDELIEDRGGEAVFVETDVTDLGEVKAAVGRAADFGKLDVLVNNAGRAESYTLEETSPENWQRTLEVNLTGVYHGCLAAVYGMLNHEGGAIVNIASVFGLVGAPNSLSYSTSKGAVIALTRQIARDLARDGIRVNAVAPGFTNTTMLHHDTHAGTVEYAETRTPMGRIGQPEEIAAAVTFLASDEASFITGHTLPVDGGYAELRT